MPAARHFDEQPRCDACNAYGDWCEAADEYRCDDCWVTEDDVTKDRHDAFLRKMVEDEYWVKIRGAKAIHDLICNVAADRYGHGSAEHCAEIDRARETFDTVIREAQSAKPARLAQLRANDASDSASPRLIVVGDHQPELSWRAA